MAVTHFATLATVLVFLSTVILKQMNAIQPKPYMDEIFHVPQVQAYCAGNFAHWDPMITTLPGMYVASIMWIKPLEWLLQWTQFGAGPLCTTGYLRGQNLVLLLINLWLFYKIISSLHPTGWTGIQQWNRGEHTDQNAVKTLGVLHQARYHTVLLSFNLATFPLLFFFSFLYYTDMGSTCFVLLGYWLSLKRLFLPSSLALSMAVMYRQTNVVWAAFTAGTVMLRHFEESPLSAEGVLRWFGVLLLSLLPYSVVAAGFAAFLYVNGSIVVGDKSHHEASLHFPQLLYFIAFSSIFAFPHILFPLQDFVRFIRSCFRPSSLLVLLLLTAVSLMLVKYFTHEHPYLLADNRHYPFYVWKNIFKRHHLIRYLLTPLYSVGVLFWWRRLYFSQSMLWIVGFFLCTAMTTVPQKLLEFRYFLLPYLLLRLHTSVRSSMALYLEVMLNAVINCVTLYIFLAKPFKWPNSIDWQRFMW